MTLINGTAVEAVLNAKGSSVPLQVASYLMLLFLQFGISCAVEYKDLIKTVRRTWVGMLVGLGGQWVVMPAFAFGLSRLFSLSELHTTALVLIGCCPGGTTSNLFAYFSSADVGLSLGMTMVSNTLAVGSLPLLLWLWTMGSDMHVPIGSILGSMCMVILPTVAGLWTRHRSKYWAAKGERAGAIMGAVTISLSVVFGISANWKIIGDPELLPWTTWTSTACLGPAGALSAAVVAYIFRLEHAQKIALLFEVAVQNLPLATAIINISFSKLDPSPLFQMQLFPIIYGLVVTLEAIALMLLLRRLKRSTTDAPRKSLNSCCLGRKGDSNTVQNESA